ncbi:MAG TPA: PIN domain-containing protein [Thermoanaerobaculia bacterium]|nr:PIN domain-containing protein [Thermoanaerobaculia bacterium]
MILLDTSVLIYAFTDQSPFLEWARRTIAAGVSEDGAAVNAVSLAEICVGDAEPETVADRIRSWDVTLLDVPAAAAGPCAKAYQEYGSGDERNPVATRSLYRCPISSSVLMLRSWVGRSRQPTRDGSGPISRRSPS